MVQIVPFVDASFNGLGCSSIFDLTLMSFCDFAFGSAQNDRVGSILRRVKVLRIEKLIIERNQPYKETKHTNQKGNWCYVYGFLIDDRYIVF